MDFCIAIIFAKLFVLRDMKCIFIRFVSKYTRNIFSRIKIRVMWGEFLAFYMYLLILKTNHMIIFICKS